MKNRDKTLGRMGGRLKMAGLMVAVLCGLGAPWVSAHPHAFVACSVSFVMDESGLVGLRQRWTLDEMTSVAVLDVVGTDRNASLSAEEKATIRDLTVESLKAYHYHGRHASIQARDQGGGSGRHGLFPRSNRSPNHCH